MAATLTFGESMLVLPPWAVAIVFLALEGCTASLTERPVRQNRLLKDTSEAQDEFTAFKWRSQLIIPEHKLALCTIAKVGFQNFNFMFNELNGFQAMDGRASTAKYMGVDWDQVTKDNGWKFAIFTRDPLERYMSAWGSKCLKDENGYVEGRGARCSGEVVSVLELGDEELVVQAFERRIQEDLKNGLPLGNAHFVSQSRSAELCDWTKFNPKTVDFLGSLTDGDASTQVHQMLQAVGGANRTDLIQKYFPIRGIAGHMSKTHGKAHRYYRKPESAMAVYHLYEKDFREMGIKKSHFLKKMMRKQEQ